MCPQGNVNAHIRTKRLIQMLRYGATSKPINITLHIKHFVSLCIQQTMLTFNASKLIWANRLVTAHRKHVLGIVSRLLLISFVKAVYYTKLNNWCNLNVNYVLIHQPLFSVWFSSVFLRKDMFPFTNLPRGTCIKHERSLINWSECQKHPNILALLVYTKLSISFSTNDPNQWGSKSMFFWSLFGSSFVSFIAFETYSIKSQVFRPIHSL